MPLTRIQRKLDTSVGASMYFHNLAAGIQSYTIDGETSESAAAVLGGFLGESQAATNSSRKRSHAPWRRGHYCNGRGS